ncbi:MAG: tRNA preQ1(34) S-adenosylmethionine ribosyltransferase-isomerase QueA [Candidatus Melainabacteria bacterium]|nr:tRNA preQ1(34) S-adenosylmethionine ribosyltransferase-isomerase QueA [Candidatus Melainabacteria bacterium]
MEKQKNELDLKDFEFELPPELIAQEPLEKRDTSRLLVVDREENTLQHVQFKDILRFFKVGDVIVANDTQVIPAKLFARRKSGGIVKLLLLKSTGKTATVWEALATSMKRLKVGEELLLDSTSGKVYSLLLKDLTTGPDGFKRLLIDLGDRESVFEVLKDAGYAPLPPYIQQAQDKLADANSGNRLKDLNRYQTVFARNPGAVAAPTAGLHFTNELIAQLNDYGIELHKITLHVGPGTFKPISTSVHEHTIEAERYSIARETATAVNEAKKRGSRIIAVGTTSLRALESAADNGLLKAVEDGSTSLYVKPGHQFKIVDSLITNFHLSGSSLLVLVAAFAGRQQILRAYKEAVEQRYRFYSYGDAMLIL